MTLQNTTHIKKGNCQLIKQAIKLLGVGTKAEVMRLSGLSLATCSNLINEMAAQGELLTCAELRSQETGRPSTAYAINPNFAYILCVFVENIAVEPCIRYAVMDLFGEVKTQGVVACDLLDYAAIEGVVKGQLKHYPEIATIGFSVQGIVETDGAILNCDNSLLQGINLTKRMEQSTKLPVICENDMNVMAYGLAQDDTISDGVSVAAVAYYPQLSAGSGLVVNGKILHGSTNFAGEVSFFPSEGCSELDVVTNQLMSIAVVVNPSLIAIAGNRIDEQQTDEVRTRMQGYLPAGHCPRILKLDEPFLYAQKGLAELCLRALDET